MRATIAMFVSLTLSILAAGDPRAQTTLAPPARTAASSPPATQPATLSMKLFKDSRQSLAIARAQGRSTVTLLVAAEPGRAAMVDQQAAALGARVRYRNDGVSYLRVDTPIDRVESLIASPEVAAVALDVDDGRDPARSSDVDTLPRSHNEDSGEQSLPTAQTPHANTETWPPVPGDFPMRHPYSAINEVDAAKMLADHPTWDGRGVTIAVLDGTFDFLLPEFQTAYALDGARIPKLVDVLNATDPETDAAFTPQWVDMRTVVESRDRRMTHEGKTFSAPGDGAFRLGLFNERAFNVVANAAYIDQDVDRNGNPRQDDGLFGVLWDERTNEVWVDTNRNLDFTDEKAMTDYHTRQDLASFGTDDPKTPVRDSIGFTVQTDATKKFVSLNLGMYQHSTGILGAVAGNREPNGRLNGLAPGAGLVSIMYRSAAHALIEALILAFNHPAVDVIVLEQNVTIATLPYWLADARHPISIVAQRLIDRHGKLLFVPASNAPGLGIVGEDGLAPGAISVGGYQHKESYRVNYGFVPEANDNMHYGGLSHGPSGIGALKPDLLAPSGMMSTDVGFRKGDVKRGLYRLPPGYRVAGGTSTATPMAAASAALIVSAAKQLGLMHDAVRLKAALVGSARYIPRLAAHEQGNGLIQVGAAIELLRRLQSAPPITIVSRAPVRTKLSHLLETPHQGVGIFEREGWAPGDRGERTVTFTRTSGPAAPLTLGVRWEGNDGTFSSPAMVTLPLNMPVTFPVQIAVTEAGAHSAVLTLEHASHPGPAHRMLATIIAAHQFQADQGFLVSTRVTVPRPGDRGVFVNVPRGVSALAIAAEGGSARVSLIDPLRSQRSFACFAPPSAGGPPRCAVGQPAAGVWEINLWGGQDGFEFDPEAPQPGTPATITLTATLLGIDVTPSATASPTRPDTAFPLELTLSNRLGKTEAAATALALGSGFSVSRTITAGAQHIYEITIPPGATSLNARMRTNNPTADLDIYLLDCTTSPAPPPMQERERGNKAPPAPPVPCASRDSAADDTSDGEVEVPDPAPGRWVVVVDAFAVPSGTVEYAYRDVFTHPRFGALAVTDVPATRDRLQQWTSKANAWVAELPDSPRVLLGRATVTGPAGVEFFLSRPSEGLGARREWRVPLGAVDLQLNQKTENGTPSRAGPDDF